jgi:signal transduction histidine kinase
MPPVNLSSKRPDNLDNLSGIETQFPELVFLQEPKGRYLSFHWQLAPYYGIDVTPIVGQGLEACFRPVQTPGYLGRLQRVLDTQQSERFECDFYCRNQLLRFALVMTPLAQSHGLSNAVIVTGTQLALPVDRGRGSAPLPTVSPECDHRMLAQLAWNIRQTLDLKTIWQRTVDGLGAALNASRCGIYSLDETVAQAKLEAEFRCEGIDSLLGTTIEIQQDRYFHQALTRFCRTDQEAPTLPVTPMTPCVVANELHPQTQRPQTRLIIATGYQGQPNSLIVLYQCDRPRMWHPSEVAFLRELADQVGTAIAHASLFNQLQKANRSLVRKQEALEEARLQAEEASRLKSEFLANTSHELRTPLNGMLGFIKLVMDGMADNPEEEQEFLLEAFRSAEHLLDIINDVLDLAKIEAGKMQIDCGPVNLNELLRDVERLQGPSAKQKRLTLEVQLPPTLDEVVVFGNYQRLKQVLINLVGNAVKFTHDGGVTISTELVRKHVYIHQQNFPGMVMVRVADTGIGVSLDKQDRLFQSFSQIDGSLTRRYGGTGLGLAISQRLVEAMGGEVNFYSMGEGLGSTVTFTVPLFQEPVVALG